MKAIGVVVFGLSIGLGAASERTPPNSGEKGATMSSKAKGTFEVKMTPVAMNDKDSLASARLMGDKTFAGDLVGTSKGEMWTADTGVKGSAGYVAIEKVSGSVRGRSGTFTVLHQGTMKGGGGFDMRLVVVPDSGTGELTGLSGSMSIVIEGGKHFYELDYTLPESSK
jgi:hypothetical protein